MRHIRRRLLAAAALACLALATGASAQAPTVVKFPGGPDVFPVLPGRFQALVGAIVEWHVVLDNRFGTGNIVFNYYDVMDPLGVNSCDGGTPCFGADQLELLCEAPYLPDPDGGTVVLCDTPLGILDIQSVTVTPGSTSCIRFFTRILNGARATGGVRNIGCVEVVAPLTVTTVTRPTTELEPACFPMPGSNLTTDCSEILVPNIEPPSFTGLKTATVEDVNGNGVNDIGDVITWTVELTNTGLDPHDGWVYDDIPDGTSFLDILDNPDGACAYTAPRIDCTVLSFAPGETKILRFRTTIECAIFTDDDTSAACNTAYVCNDAGLMSCGPTDDDTTPPPQPTCVPVPMPDLTSATKSWALLDDVDGDGALSDGDRVRFTMEIRNEGTGSATNVRLVDLIDVACFDDATISPGAANYDPVFDTLTWTIADLPPGGYELNFVDVDVIDTGGSCCNQATITHDERDACSLPPLLTDDPGTPAIDDTTCVQFGPLPLLRVEKDFTITQDADGDGEADPGDELTFTITIVNEGAGVATDVVIDDPLVPCWAGFVAADVLISGAGVNESTELAPPMTPNRVRVTGIGGADGLAPLGAEIVTITFVVTYEPGALPGCCNEAVATYAESPYAVRSDDPMTGFRGDQTCTTRTVQSAELVVTKTATEQVADGCLQPGENVTFTITVAAEVANASLIQLRDDISDLAGVFDVVNSNGGVIEPGGNAITWDFGDVAAGTSRDIQWIGRFACDAKSGDSIEDVASAVAINAPSASSLPVVSTVAAPELSATLTLTSIDADGSGTLTAGDTSVITVTVENVGACNAPSVVIEMQVDADLDRATIVAEGTPDIGAGGMLTWDETTTPALASLASGASVTYRVEATVLEPASNPAPDKDGVVGALVQATASTPFVVCPLLSRSPTSQQIIDARNAFLLAVMNLTDDDLDGCHEPGEPLTIDIEITPVAGAGDDVVATLSLGGVPGLFTVLEDDGGTVAGDPPVITWNLGTLPADVPVPLQVIVALSCDFADGETFEPVLDVTSSNLAAVAESLGVLRASAPLLEITKTWSWDDADGDSTVDAGETLKYELVVRNVGTCQVREITVLDPVDADLDVTNIRLTPLGDDDGVGGITWSGLGLDPGERIFLTLETEVLDPATNPDVNANGYLDNTATVLAGSVHGCPDVPWYGSAAQVAIGEPPVFRLLRSDFITCREDALQTMAAILRPRPEPEECSDPPAIDPLHRGTQVVDGVVSPWSFAGDADPASSFGQCPQTLVGFGRILILYELDDPDPICLRSLRLRKVGGAVEVRW